MKAAAAVVAFACASSFAWSQGVETAEERLAKKLKSPFMQKAKWHTDFDKARHDSGETGKPIFVYFTQSTPPNNVCENVENTTVFSTDEFVNWAKDWTLYCHITSHVPGDKAANLHKDMGCTRWPDFLFTDQDGNIIGRHFGGWFPVDIKRSGDWVLKAVDLRKKFVGGDKSVAADLFDVSVKLMLFKLAAGTAAGGALKDLTPQQQKMVDGALVNLAVQDAVLQIKHPAIDQIKVGKAFLEMRRAGKVPTGENEMLRYLFLICVYTEANRELKPFEEALKMLKEKYGDIASAQQRIKQFEASLEKLKENDKDQPPK